MAKPPESTPHSDLDGIHQDEERNSKVAGERGESGEELKHAHDEAQGRPPYDDEAEGHPS
jgi:hypothetical protein